MTTLEQMTGFGTRYPPTILPCAVCIATLTRYSAYLEYADGGTETVPVCVKCYHSIRERREVERHTDTTQTTKGGMI